MKSVRFRRSSENWKQTRGVAEFEIHRVVEQAEAAFVAQLLVLAADVGDLAQIERQAQRIERRPPQFSLGHGAAEDGQRFRLLAAVARALIGDVGRGRRTLEQEGLLAIVGGADLEDRPGQPQPVAAVRRGDRGDLTDQLQPAPEVVAPECRIDVRLQLLRGLADGARLGLDLGLQPDRRVGQIVAFEGLVGSLS